MLLTFGRGAEMSGHTFGGALHFPRYGKHRTYWMAILTRCELPSMDSLLSFTWSTHQVSRVWQDRGKHFETVGQDLSVSGAKLDRGLYYFRDHRVPEESSTDS